MDYSTEQEFRKVYRALKCKANCSDVQEVLYQVTESAFNTLVTDSTLKFPAIYEITDVENGLYIQTLSGSTFSPDAALSFLAPDYTLHTQYHSTDGAIANGATVTWGGFYWTNTSGGSVTPNLTSEAILDNTGAFTKVTKSVANGYEAIVLNVMVDTSLFIFSAKDEFGNEVKVNANLNALIGFNPIDIFQWNDQRIFNNTVLVCNNKLTQSTCLIYENDGDFDYSAINTISSVSQNLLTNSTLCAIYSNSVYLGSKISGNTLSGIATIIKSNIQNENCLIQGNTISGIQASIEGYFQTSLCEINNNVLSGNPSTNGSVTIAYGQQDDDCELNGNILSGGGSQFFDNHQHEACKLNTNTLSGDNTRISHVIQYKADECNSNTISANTELIDLVFQDGNINKLNGCVISTGKSIQNLRMSNSELLNSTVTLKELNVQGIVVDLTGFTTDIEGETYQSGNGWFTITHNFGTSNLVSGASVLYNLIPTGARLTNCTIIPSSITGGAGATLRIGLESDDVSYGLAATAVGSIVNTVVNTVSNAATANRSLQLTAGVNNITGGSITIKIEFIL